MKNRKDDIERYLRGELSPAEMHVLEKEALNDPFLAEALEGVEQAGADNFLYDLHALSHSLHHRARARKNKTIKMWGWTAGVAATVLLVAVSGFLVVSLIKDQNGRRLALEQKTGVEQKTGSSTDSVVAPLDSEPSVAPKERKNSRRDDERNIKPEIATATEAVKEGPSRESVVGNEAPLGDAEVKQEETEKLQPLHEEVAHAEGAAVEKQHKVEKPAEALTEKAALRKSRQREAKATAPAETSVPLQVMPTPADSVLLKGKVVSAEDGEGLPGVNVVIKGTAIGTATDAQGNYQLKLPSAEGKLLFSFIGFETSEVPVAGRQEINVQLQDDVSQLSEVIVTGYDNAGYSSGQDKVSFQPAEPEGGKNDFKKYLMRSVKYPEEALKSKVHGKVTVRFTVAPTGELNDFEVVKGIGHGCDEELIRLVREGPPWRPGTHDDQPVAEKVKVRLRFELPD